jgi:hypothetical protein
MRVFAGRLAAPLGLLSLFLATAAAIAAVLSF